MCRPALPLLLLPIVLAAPPASAEGHGFSQPMRHGVVFWQTATPEEGIRQLEDVAAEGFRLVTLASWCWTLPTPGSDLERSARAMLEWCDEHGMAFFLLQNIQFGSEGEGGGLDQAVTEPLAARVYLDDWVHVLAGHPCVAGAILGNEVGPLLGNRADNPLWWAGMLASLRERYGELDALNAAWGTGYEAWDAIEVPGPGEPGRESVELYAEDVFARFYSALFTDVLRPALGDLEYGVKTVGDPILHRRMTEATVIGYDDVLANYPQWRVKALCDVGRAAGKPVFNSEIHLYHDTYVYNQSAEMTRYRYLTSALNGETTTASFAWGQWSGNPATAAIHAETPGVLRDLDRLREPLASLAAAEPTVHVLLTGALCRGEDWGEDGQRPAAERLYADMAGLGEPWDFVLEEDVPRLTRGPLIASEGADPSPACLASIEALPAEVPVVAGIAELEARAGDPGAPYTELTETPYLWWLPDRGHFREGVVCPKLEARRVRRGGGWLIAVVNHATEGPPVRAALPWPDAAGAAARELTTDGARIPAGTTLDFAPLSVRLFEVP